MTRAERVREALRDVVDIRVALRSEPPDRDRLAAVVRRRRTEIGTSVPKRSAAALLGVSVTTLDRWIARGALPVVRRRGSTRAELEPSTLIRLAVEVDRQRSTGRQRGLLAAAFERIGARPTMGMPGYFPDHRQDRRDDFLHLTPAERVAQAIELSRVGSILAAAGAASREDR